MEATELGSQDTAPKIQTVKIYTGQMANPKEITMH